jgi:hypothetical protein
VNVIATFGRAVPLRVRASGAGGLLRYEGVPCFGACTWDLIPGESVGITVDPEVGNRFVGWRGLCAGVQRTCVVTVTRNTADPSITAVFRRLPQRTKHGGKARES